MGSGAVPSLQFRSRMGKRVTAPVWGVPGIPFSRALPQDTEPHTVWPRARSWTKAALLGGCDNFTLRLVDWSAHPALVFTSSFRVGRWEQGGSCALRLSSAGVTSWGPSRRGAWLGKEALEPRVGLDRAGLRAGGSQRWLCLPNGCPWKYGPGETQKTIGSRFVLLCAGMF